MREIYLLYNEEVIFMKPVEEALREFRRRNKQLMDEFDRIMELEKVILSQMTIDKTFEELQHLDLMASGCEQIAREILEKADNLAEEMKTYVSKMMEESL